MKLITKDLIISKVKEAIFNATHILGDYAYNKLIEAKEAEEGLAKEILTQLIDNANIAKKESIPMCQDTGIVTVFLEIGSEVSFDCNPYEAINQAVSEAYTEYYLRKSVCTPLDRMNSNDNTPAIIHTKYVYGSNELKMKIAPKGAGSENMSALKMLNPTDGESGIVKFVVDTVKAAGGRPCPPIYVGIGIGGNFETCALMAKEALLRETPSADLKVKELEERIKEELNKTNVGVMGLGGKTTCFEVFINTYSCHIASLPVAINIQCHANRHVEVVL